jgi:hypothetical protein
VLSGFGKFDGLALFTAKMDLRFPVEFDKAYFIVADPGRLALVHERPVIDPGVNARAL